MDLTGTLHVGSTPLPGAVEAVNKLVASKRVKLRVLTNTSNKSLSTLHQQLHDMGFVSIEKDQIFTSVLATKHYLKQNGLRPFCIMEDTCDFDNIPLDPPHNCVVVALAPSKSDYQHLNQAYQILQEFPDNLICMHRGTYIKNEAGGQDLGPGAFVAALEAASGSITAKVMGKPSREFFESACFPDVASEEMCMVGDSVAMDVYDGFGTNILVKTGKYKAGDEEKGACTVAVPSIVEAVDYILQHVAIDEFVAK